MDKRTYLTIKPLIHNEYKAALLSNNYAGLFCSMQPDLKLAFILLFDEIGIKALDIALKNMSTIEAGFFTGFSGSVVIPANIRKIDKNAFKDSDVANVNINSTYITTIPDDFFSGCSNLESVTLPKSIRDISIEAFSDCTDNLLVTVPAEAFNADNFDFSFDESEDEEFIQQYVRKHFKIIK